MSQNILSIDSTASPAVAAVICLDGGKASVLEKGFFAFSKSELQTQPETQGTPADFSLTETASFPYPALPAVVAGFKQPWTNSVLIIPPRDSISLWLKLPFDDRKKLLRVIPGEVQDLLPFEIDDLLLQHRCTGKNGSGYQIHVSAVPKERIGQELEVARLAGVDPAVLCTPATALGLLFESEAGSSLARNAAAIFPATDHCSVVFVHEGRACFEHCIIRESADTETDLSNKAALAISAVSERLSLPLDAVYLCGPGLDTEILASGISARLEIFSPGSIPGCPDAETVLATLAAGSVIDQNAPVPLTNFRTHQFTYRPHLDELFKGLKTLLPSVIIAVLCGLLALLCTYYTRQLLVHNMRSNLNTQIKTAIPWLNLRAGSELGDLQNEIESLDRQLKDLGSPSHTTPLDALTEISKYLPSTAEITVRVISIRGSKVTLEGDAPDYAAVDRLEKALKKRKRVFCDIKKSEATGGAYYGAANTRPFSFTLSMCE